MKSVCTRNKKQLSSFSTASSLLTLVSLWLMLATANTSAHAQTEPSPADWTEFHRDNMQRWNPYETVLGVNVFDRLQLKWNSAVGAFSSSPAVVNGVLYIGSIDENLYALDTSTGRELWSYPTGEAVNSSPAVANGVVYVSSDYGRVYALDAKTGAQMWIFDTGETGSNLSSPAVANGVVYVGSVKGNVYALNAATGAALWSFTTGDAALSSPAVANGVVYIGSYDDNVYALNANTGTKLWSFTTGAGVFSSPAVANGVVYIGSYDDNVYALNASTGAKLWSYTTGNLVDSSPAVANGAVYIGSYDHNVYALNASTGAKLWSFTTGEEVLSSPAVANGVVYVGSDDDKLYALNASTGAQLWSYGTAGTKGFAQRSSPTIVDGTVYFSAGILGSIIGGRTYAFSLGDADLFLRIRPTPTTVQQGDLLTYAFPVWNLGPTNANLEVLRTQVPEGTTFDYIRISGTPGLGTCTHPPYQGTGQIICHENSAMAPNTTWTVRLTVKVTAPAGTVITENAATMADTFDPNLANNTATVSLTVQ